ncbi:MAG: hypothetical protein QG610_1004 [Euryarchaeota archaeon]|nr:hypothetical protein [Euryarchaeota archaeon]
MREQLEQRLVELRAEYESGKKILKDIELKLAELENRKRDLNETLIRISGAVDILEEILEKENKSITPETPEILNTESQDIESHKTKVEVPFVIRLPVEQAVKKLDESGLRAGSIGEKSVFVGGVRFGNVIQQEPKGGMLAERGSTVDLVVAKKGNLKPDLSQNSLLSSYSKH